MKIEVQCTCMYDPNKCWFYIIILYAQWFWRGFFFISLKIFKLKRSGPFIWNKTPKTNFYLLHPILLCAKFGWNKPGGSEVDLKMSSMYIRYFLVIPHPPLKRAWPFVWTHFNFLYPRMLCDNFVEISPTFSPLFCNYHPLKKAGPLIWTN